MYEIEDCDDQPTDADDDSSPEKVEAGESTTRSKKVESEEELHYWVDILGPS